MLAENVVEEVLATDLVVELCCYNHHVRCRGRSALTNHNPQRFNSGVGADIHSVRRNERRTYATRIASNEFLVVHNQREHLASPMCDMKSCH